MVVFLAITKRDVIRTGPVAAPPGAGPAVLVVLNKVMPTEALLAAVAAAGRAVPGGFSVLVPNPDNLGFDHGELRRADRSDLLARAIPRLRDAVGAEVSGRVAKSPNAYDDIVEELDRGTFTEIILETPPTHLSHWLHVDLPTASGRARPADRGGGGAGVSLIAR